MAEAAGGNADSRNDLWGTVFRRILVPTDGSSLSLKAARHAIALARPLDAHLVGLHVLPRFSNSRTGLYRPVDGPAATAYDRRVRGNALRLFAPITREAGAAAVAFEAAVLESNDVWKAIIEAARRKRCDLICMASHGRRGLSAVVLGSETHKVLTHSQVPVLVIR